ncbi:response regulator transcription factor [Pelagibius sp. Alg239-R121]|uniref:response regulator n=1 Tax=Pelagibius sp. Alg239-R121 TaxID=2993448 RepID=UPI0024A620FD|nr:response regulator transcription factor [Pelagibius sp. Alg239-R121]
MKFLLVDDEAVFARQIQDAANREGFTLDLAVNGADGYLLGQSERYDAVILDLGLPVKDGVTVLREWRAEGITTPVLILTARGRWQDRVDGLNAGADDYLVKPFQTEELVARLRALVRRSVGAATSELNFAGVSVNTETGRVFHRDHVIEVTNIELKLLTAMMLRPDKVHSKFELAERVYGYNEDRGSNTLEVYIARLRQKIDRTFIRTIRGRGYTIGNADCPDL